MAIDMAMRRCRTLLVMGPDTAHRHRRAIPGHMVRRPDIMAAIDTAIEPGNAFGRSGAIARRGRPEAELRWPSQLANVEFGPVKRHKFRHYGPNAFLTVHADCP